MVESEGVMVTGTIYGWIVLLVVHLVAASELLEHVKPAADVARSHFGHLDSMNQS